ncbi:MAG: hypothetical protein V4474_03640 [Patescibacteria group bacterium]
MERLEKATSYALKAVAGTVLLTFIVVGRVLFEMYVVPNNFLIALATPICALIVLAVIFVYMALSAWHLRAWLLVWRQAKITR